MAIKRIYPALFLLLLCFQCEEDIEGIEDCAAVTCLANAEVVLEVLEDGENIFENGAYSLEDVTIEGDNTDDLELTLFVNQDSKTLLQLRNSNWQLGLNVHNLNFENDVSIGLQIDISFIGEAGGCCGKVSALDGLLINDESQNIPARFYTISLD